MKVFLLSFAIFLAWPSFAAVRVQCATQGNVFIIDSTSPSDLRVTFQNETVKADGYLGSDEVDLVARFKSIGEMTLFAKIGKNSPESYIFFKGKKLSVSCR